MRRLLFSLCLLCLASGAGANTLTLRSSVPPAPQLPNSFYPIAQTFSGNVVNGASVLPGNVSWIWSTGGGGGSNPQSPIAGVNSGGYWPLYAHNGSFQINGVAQSPLHTPTWFLANHPNWVMYKCDKATIAFPARGYTANVTNNSATVTVTSSNVDTDLFTVGNGVYGAGFPVDGTTVSAYSGSGLTVTMADKFTGTTGSETVYFSGGPGKSTPLAFDLTPVQNWVKGFLSQYLSAGFGSLDFDNANVANYGNQCGWFAGAQSETNTVVNAIAGAGGVVRLILGSAIPSGDFVDGNPISVAGVNGTTEANGSFDGHFIDSTHIELEGTTFTNTYISGGTVSFAKGNPPSFGGTWVQPFTGVTGAFLNDQNFEEAAINWACSLTSWAHQQPGSPFTVGNVFTVGTSFDNDGTNEVAWSFEQRMASCFDVLGQESVFHSCKTSTVTTRTCLILTDNAFARGFLFDESRVPQQMWWYISYPPCTVESGPNSCVSLGRQADEAYDTATFLMFRSMPGAPPSFWSPIGFLNLGTGTEHGAYAPPDATWEPAVGNPLGTAALNSGGCYERFYQHGQVEINASSTATCTYTAPANAKDQFGNSITAGTETLPLETAIVLVTP